MPKESATLTQKERDLLDEISRFYRLAGWKQTVELNPAQHEIWQGIVKKAVRYPCHDYAADIEINRLGEETFKGQVITSTAKRKKYTKRNNLRLRFSDTGKLL